MKKKFKIILNKENSNIRIDIALTKVIPEITRSEFKNYCTLLLVNGKKEKLSYKGKDGDLVEVELEWSESTNVIPENIPLNIVYEDANYIIINKPFNMVVHPSKGNYQGTLVNALYGMKKDLSDYHNDLFRPGIVHRLDKETSGLIIVAKSNQSHQYLSSLFMNRKIIKKYHAIVKGVFIASNLLIENNIGRHPVNRKKMSVVNSGGKKSLTYIKKSIHNQQFSYLDIQLLTGRTHQIRVHLAHKGYPVLGDLIYSRNHQDYPGIPLCLVAYRLAFHDVFSGKDFDFQINDPEHMQKLLSQFNK